MASFRHQLTFCLHELNTVRIVCRNACCGAIVEVPLDRLPWSFSRFACPVCQMPFQPAGVEGANPLVQLHQAIAGLQHLKAQLHIEFVLPQEA